MKPLLSQGDFILDSNNEEIEIVGIVHTKKYTNQFNILKKNELCKNVPNKDLIISDHHILKHNGKIYLPKTSEKFKRLPRQEIEFYHIVTVDYTNGL